jgi:hypothetical protein
MSELVGKKLWLDDAHRPPSKDWVWALTVDAALELLNTGTVIEASFDNDLYPFERDGLEVVEWMIDHQVFPRLVAVHSSNEAASIWMCGLLQRVGYRRVPGRSRQFLKGHGGTRSTEEIVTAP